MEGPRPVRPDEYDSLIKLANVVFTGDKRAMDKSFPNLFNRDNLNNLWVFVDEGRVVSHVGIRLDEIILLGCRVKVASVGSVATYQEYRGRHLATALLAAAEDECVERGVAVVLISGWRGLYSRYGTRKIGHSTTVTIPAGPAPDGLAVHEVSVPEAALLSSIYQREPVRFHRPLGDWQTALRANAARTRGHGQQKTFLISDANGPAAYVVCSTYVDDDVRRSGVREFAGDRSLIFAAIPSAPLAMGIPDVDLSIPDFDPELNRAFAASPLEGRPGPLFGHTVKVSSVTNFIRAVTPLLEERLGSPAASGLIFQDSPGGGGEAIIGEERTGFDAPAFTLMAFGNPEADGNETPFLAGVFPLPLPLPGLNYV